MLVYDPINLENMSVIDYLKNDSNNIVIILNKKAYGVNKALFMFNNEMKRCIIANNALLKKATYDNTETFYNIGYFIGKKVIVNLNTLNDVLKKHRIIELTSKTKGDTYINKELLELTSIGILKPPSKNSVGNVNFKHAYEDVYFDELMSSILKEYSLEMYYYINRSLINPELYNQQFNNKGQLNYELVELLKKISKNTKNFKNINFKNAVDKMVIKIDKGFIEAAPRYENTYVHKVFYRGMKEKYINTNGDELENIGDTALILNYTSVSSEYNAAKNFAASGSKAIIYKIYLEEGLPFINMVSTAVFEDEYEYLLPRNIIFELISKKGNEYTILAKPFKPDQFTIKTGCLSLDFYDITPTTLSTTLSYKQSKTLSPSLSKVKSNVDSGKSKNNIISIKLKRCPRGMMRHKITKECVPKQNKQTSVIAKSKPKTITKTKAKLGRCPKGTRRNPKTLLCEAKV
jgi:hypothetical protein